jgi:hypothetical protein
MFYYNIVQIFKNRKHDSCGNRTANLSTKERVTAWTKELNLLVTNLEHLSAKELQQKHRQVQVKNLTLITNPKLITKIKLPFQTGNKERGV